MDDGDVAEEQDDSEERVLTPPEAFSARLTLILSTFSNRQAELLRVSQYIDERAFELDDAKARAKRRIEEELREVDDDLVDRYLRAFAVLKAKEEDDGLSSGDRSEALRVALEEIRAELPEGVESTYLNAVLRSMSPAVGVGFLHSSLLTTLVGELEMLINQVARACFEIRPSSLDDSGRTFTWTQISGFESIDDLRDWVVDRTVDEVLRGSLKDWMKFFENRFGIGPIAAATTFEAVEAVQRRHCIVHNAGQASQQYIDHLADFPLEAALHDELPVDAAYLQRAADTLFLVAYSLVWALGVKLNPDEKQWYVQLSSLVNRTMFLLQERRYDLVMKIGRSVPYNSLKGEDLEYLGFILHVNNWIAYKELGRFDEVRDAVEKYPVRTRDDSHKLAILALLDRNDEAYALAQKMMDAGDLLPSHLLTWPLLRGVRDYARAQLNAEDESQE